LIVFFFKKEEQRAVENANKLLAGQPVSVSTYYYYYYCYLLYCNNVVVGDCVYLCQVHSEEERLMLLGMARDEGEARQLMIAGTGTLP